MRPSLRIGVTRAVAKADATQLFSQAVW